MPVPVPVAYGPKNIVVVAGAAIVSLTELPLMAYWLMDLLASVAKKGCQKLCWLPVRLLLPFPALPGCQKKKKRSLDIF